MPEPRPVEMTVYFFCRNKKFSYIPIKMLFEAFKGSAISTFSFYRVNLPPEALRTEIELFATRLGDFFWTLGYTESPEARWRVRDTVKKEDDPIQNLLDVVRENYK